MKIFFKLLPVIILTVVFCSCDPQTCGTDFIENHSSDTVFLYRADSVTVDTVLAGRGIEFAPVCGCCGVPGGQQPEHSYQYLYVRNTDTVCKKDIRNPEDWISAKIERLKWEHRFTITDADF
jgi:hypothetical protein